MVDAILDVFRKLNELPEVHLREFSGRIAKKRRCLFIGGDQPSLQIDRQNAVCSLLKGLSAKTPLGGSVLMDCRPVLLKLGYGRAECEAGG